MSDYIDREETVKTVRLFNALTEDEEEWEIRKIPSADVAPVRHGHWIKISPAGIYECSECGKNVMTSDIEAYEHCHGCGSRMDGDYNE